VLFIVRVALFCLLIIILGITLVLKNMKLHDNQEEINILIIRCRPKKKLKAKKRERKKHMDTELSYAVSLSHSSRWLKARHIIVYYPNFFPSFSYRFSFCLRHSSRRDVEFEAPFEGLQQLNRVNNVTKLRNLKTIFQLRRVLAKARFFSIKKNKRNLNYNCKFFLRIFVF